MFHIQAVAKIKKTKMSERDSDASDYEETEAFCKTEKLKKHMYKKLKDKHGLIYAELIGPYAEEKYGK